MTEHEFLTGEAETVVTDDPQVPPRVRTVAYFVLLVAAAVVLLAQGLAPIWLEPDTASKVVSSAGVFSAVFGLIGGGLGVAYRPTRLG